MNVLEIVADVASRLNQKQIRYVVGGSLSSSIWGQMRQTNDADIAIQIGPDQINQLVEVFTDSYWISEGELRETLSSTIPFRAVQMLHMDEAFKIDFFLLEDTEYVRTELLRARDVILPNNVVARYAAPENIAIAKLRWYELGHRVSDRQWNDIVQVLEIQKGLLDEPYLDHWADFFGLRELLDEARSQTCP